MGLNLKNEEAHRLAQELARLTGESMTAAVTTAIRERLERIRGERSASLADRLVMIGKDCAAHLKEPFRSADEPEAGGPVCVSNLLARRDNAIFGLTRGS